MQLEILAPNQTLVYVKGMTFLVSYSTPVAVKIHGSGYFRTDKFHSTTTSKHINNWLDGRKAERMSQSEINELFNNI